MPLLGDTVKAKHAVRRALHLFSGPSNRVDGISAILREIGWECDDIDICNASPDDKGSNDLLNDANWISIHSKIRQGIYKVVFMGTPCNTFSRLRSHPGGPPPLRSKARPQGLHKDELSKADFDALTSGNYLAARSSETANLCCELNMAWAIEHPQPWEYTASLWDLKQF